MTNSENCKCAESNLDECLCDFYEEPRPTWSKPCGSCGATVARYRGQGDVMCQCGAWYNAGGQRLRDDWMGNSAWGDDDLDDMEGFERQHMDW